MDFETFQTESAKTDQVSANDANGVLVPLLGLAGEVGTLLSEYKKYLRDGTAHQRFEEQVSEELGDLLWYISNVASKFNLDLGEIADSNLEKTKSRWLARKDSTLFDSLGGDLFDSEYPKEEQFPREFSIEIRELNSEGKCSVALKMDGESLGDELTDNAHDDDGYRFHDVFHLSYLTILGWSPIFRKLMDRKRRSNQRTDEIEDGARAGIIEELISQLVFAYAREHNFLEGVNRLDYHLLKTIQTLVHDREVKHCSLADWENAILAGYSVWRQVRANGSGCVRCNLLQRQITFEPLEKRSRNLKPTSDER